MKRSRIKELIGFYENELTNNILSFWLSRCLDKENGGYLNCFDNRGLNLVSHDKYTWSQGRFVWLWAKLALMDCGTFTMSQRSDFLELARSGRDFLMQHCLIDSNDWRCVFLMDEKGNPKQVDGFEQLDMSIYADCFVIAGLGKFAEAADDPGAYKFCENLYLSVLDRIRSGKFNTLPYPLSSGYRAHGIPMILSNVTKEIYSAAEKFNPGFTEELRRNIDNFTMDILDHFVDENNVLHEIIRSDNNKFPDNLLGQHANPGHTIEDCWFMMDAAELNEKHQIMPRIAAVAKKVLENGWDEEFGGLLHFCGINGEKPEGSTAGVENEPMLKQTLTGWSDKLWWVHSEALYTSLRLYFVTGNDDFLSWYEKIFAYTFDTFPNPDRAVREWIQIMMRNGKPQDKVVALPVKDPYHISRNIILIIELLYKMSYISEN